MGQLRPLVDAPGFGLTPDLVNAVFRAAEGGILWRRADLFDDVLESDGHLRSLVLGRRDAVAGKEWVIQAGGKDASSIAAAEALAEKLRDSLNFHEFLEHQLMAPYYGWSATEIDWAVDGGVVFPAYLAPQGNLSLAELAERALRVAREPL
jgi:phage gp29-like protein